MAEGCYHSFFVTATQSMGFFHHVPYMFVGMRIVTLLNVFAHRFHKTYRKKSQDIYQFTIHNAPLCKRIITIHHTGNIDVKKNRIGVSPYPTDHI
jgi:hypothetical protein